MAFIHNVAVKLTLGVLACFNSVQMMKNQCLPHNRPFENQPDLPDLLLYIFFRQPRLLSWLPAPM